MPRKEKNPAFVPPYTGVPIPSAPVPPPRPIPTAGEEPVSPAVAIWLDAFADAIVALALREAAHA